MRPALLATVTRADWIESLHYGWGVVLDARGQVVERMGGAIDIFARSSLKPIQAVPLLETGTADDFGLSETELAIACSSHSGTEAHLAEVRSLLEKADVLPSKLRCGAHLPLDEAVANGMIRRDEAPTPLHNNCSGKHAGMLAVCRHQGWDLDTYDRFDHPLQQAIRLAIARYAGVPAESLVAGVDGCGVPAWRLPIEGLALAFSRLTTEPALSRLASAMANHPVLVAGDGRFDTVLMKAAGDRLIAKGGAEAVHVGADRRSGLAWAVKVADGNRRAISPVVIALLAKYGLLTDREGHALVEWARPPITNRPGVTVGHVQSVVAAADSGSEARRIELEEASHALRPPETAGD